MPATFAAVSPRIWSAELAQRSSRAQLVRLYVASCPIKTSEGFYRLPIGYIAADLGMEPQAITAALVELSDHRIIGWDSAREIVFDPMALVASPITSLQDKRVKPALRLLDVLDDSALWDWFIEVARKESRGLYVALQEAGKIREGDATNSDPSLGEWKPSQHDEEEMDTPW